ncbi:MAG: class I SAM-dependent methyltransferase [Moraxellaceae bacterium]|nr:class I SAM-dependent methyltransferase [Moraxellaceae bacterium]
MSTAVIAQPTTNSVPNPNPNQALWEKGDFTRLAQTMRRSGEDVVASLNVEPHFNTLDVGCGDGTTALPLAYRAARVRGVDIARNLVDAGNRRFAAAGLANGSIQQGDACDLAGVPDESCDLVLSMFGAMFAPRPVDVARSLVRVTKAGGRIVMGNWIPGDPTLVAQILRISAQYAPPPAGFISPILWGVPDEVVARFGEAGIPADRVETRRDTYRFEFAGSPAGFLAVFRDYYGPTMNAYAAAQAAGKVDDLHRELTALFAAQNRSTDPALSVFDATFLRVTVRV